MILRKLDWIHLLYIWTGVMLTFMACLNHIRFEVCIKCYIIQCMLNMLNFTENCIFCIFCIFCNMCAFQLRMDNIWFCKLLLHFKVYTNGMVHYDCAPVSVLEKKYKCCRRPGHILQILHIKHYFSCLIFITILSIFYISLVILFPCVTHIQLVGWVPIHHRIQAPWICSILVPWICS